MRKVLLLQILNGEVEICVFGGRTRKSGLLHVLCGNEKQVEKDDIFGRFR
ncbi:hypothetical protein LINGRAHAP2_LOCUS26409 [Linum grandiflorum]